MINRFTETVDECVQIKTNRERKFVETESTTDPYKLR